MTPPASEDVLERVRAVVGPHDEVAGLATVDLDRASRELADAGPAEPLPDDELLGARCRLVRPAAGPPIVLLEPLTEGRLAASLARYGEGPLVHYVVAKPGAVAALRATGLPLSAESQGPLGLARLVLGGLRWGPHLVVVEVGSGRSPAATIDA